MLKFLTEDYVFSENYNAKHLNIYDLIIDKISIFGIKYFKSYSFLIYPDRIKLRSENSKNGRFKWIVVWNCYEAYKVKWE